jgi:hypothetical protein
MQDMIDIAGYAGYAGDVTIKTKAALVFLAPARRNQRPKPPVVS